MKKCLVLSLLALFVLALGLPVLAEGNPDAGSERYNVLEGKVLENGSGVMSVQMAVGTGSDLESNVNIYLLATSDATLDSVADQRVPNFYECPGKVAFNVLKNQVMQNAEGIMTVQMNVGNYNALSSDVNIVIGENFPLGY